METIKVLAINTSPRKGRNTEQLLDEIPEGKVSLENDMIPKWLSEGRRLGGFVNDGYFIDIGIPEAYFQFQEDVRNKVVI